MEMSKSEIAEPMPSVRRAVNKVVKSLKDDHPNIFKNKEYEISTEFVKPNEAVINLEINRFLSDSKADKSEFDHMHKEVIDAGEKYGALQAVEHNSYFAGAVAPSLIKRGKTIKCEALLSTISIKLVFAANFK